jgi:TolA-binding protein
MPSIFRLLALVAVVHSGLAAAQDIPGIELCTAEKSMERRTSCLQSNIDFLKRTTTQAALDQQQKLDAANRAIVALQAQVKSLQEAMAALAKTADKAKTAPASAPAAPADAKPGASPGR